MCPVVQDYERNNGSRLDELDLDLLDALAIGSPNKGQVGTTYLSGNAFASHAALSPCRNQPKQQHQLLFLLVQASTQRMLGIVLYALSRMMRVSMCATDLLFTVSWAIWNVKYAAPQQLPAAASPRRKAWMNREPASH